MKRVISFVLAGFVLVTNPAHATYSYFPTCESYVSFLTDLIIKIDRYLVSAPASLRPTLLAARSHYSNKLALISAGSYEVILVGGIPRCIPDLEHSSDD